MMKASVLVVSRTPELLNRLLHSLDRAYSGTASDVEVIASWNGSAEDEARIQPGRLPFRVVQHDPYHFASNMNGLARKASGTVLIFANDDLIADPGAIDASMERLATNPDAGIVGARLRTSSNRVAHAGMHFMSNGTPYHHLEGFVDAKHPASHHERLVPAVTGAFFAMRREDFLRLEFKESFKACGEDVLLCLQTRSILHKNILYCPPMSGLHDMQSTRGAIKDQNGTPHEDMEQIQDGWHEFVRGADKASLLVELRAVQDEAEALRGLYSELLQTLESYETEASFLKQGKVELEGLIAALQASSTKQHLEQSLLEGENKRLRSRVQQLENQLTRLEPTS